VPLVLEDQAPTTQVSRDLVTVLHWDQTLKLF
jgi:hypothetical protein